MDDKVFRDVKRVCYSGCDSVTLRRRLAELVTRAFAFDAHAFCTTDPDTGILNHMVGEGVPPALSRQHRQWMYPLHTAVRMMDQARAGKPVFVFRDDLPEVVAPARAAGFDHVTHVVFGERDRLWGTWCLFLQRHSPEHVSRAQALLRRLAPHITRGLQQAAFMHDAMSASAMHQRPAGVVVLDTADRALLRTAAVRPMLEDLGDVGFHTADQLPFAILSAAARLRSHLRRAEIDAPDHVTVRVQGRSRRWYVVQASPAQADAADGAFAVVVVRPVIAREVAAMLTDLYGLSSREREVAAAIARGLTNKEIASALRLSPHTVKEHVDRACEKTGARGRKALVARLYFDAYAPRLMESA